jgi:AbrB family looped-hinge helix DNA binding protein
MTTITMTSKGQITLPAATRAKLRLEAGSKFLVSENERGEIVLKPKTGDIRRLRGVLKYDGPPVSIDEMSEAVRRSAVESFKRSVS